MTRGRGPELFVGGGGGADTLYCQSPVQAKSITITSVAS